MPSVCSPLRSAGSALDADHHSCVTEPFVGGRPGTDPRVRLRRGRGASRTSRRDRPSAARRPTSRRSAAAEARTSPDRETRSRGRGTSRPRPDRPRRSRSRARRRSGRARATCCSWLSQSRAVIFRPSARNHQASGSTPAGRAAVEVARTPEDRMLAPKVTSRRANARSRSPVASCSQSNHESLVVLAPGVVVPPLRAGDLVAAEQHRHAVGEEERGEEVALLPRAERANRRIVGRTFDAAVPRAVVVRSRRGCPPRSPRCACPRTRRGRRG